MRKLKIPALAGSLVSVWWDGEWAEYVVKYSGRPAASYHTSDRDDALATAQKMRNGNI